MSIDVAWFQNRIRDMGASQRKLSQQMASNPNTISLILAGKRKLTHEEVGSFARLLETTPDEVLRRMGADMTPALRQDAVECIGSVDETGRINETEQKARLVSAPANSTANTRAVIMDALGGDHANHGYVYYAEMPNRDKPVDADSLNSLAVIEIGDKPGRYLGVVKRGLERGVYDVVNPFTNERIVGGVAIRNANPVTWIKTA